MYNYFKYIKVLQIMANPIDYISVRNIISNDHIREWDVYFEIPIYNNSYIWWYNDVNADTK